MIEKFIIWTPIFYGIHQIHKNGGRTRVRHLRTDRIFVNGFLPSKEEPGISFSQRKTEDMVSLHAIHATTMLFSILKSLNSMLPIIHPRPIPSVRHFYKFSVLKLRLLNSYLGRKFPLIDSQTFNTDHTVIYKDIMGYKPPILWL